jgi:hypothetical protein
VQGRGHRPAHGAEADDGDPPGVRVVHEGTPEKYG